LSSLFLSNNSCCKEEGYTEIKDNKGESDALDDLKKEDFAYGDEIFEGLRLKRKYTTKFDYESNRMWVDLPSKSLHVSVYDDKVKSHKEASIAQITEIIFDGPLKNPTKTDPHCPPGERCLTVLFGRGGIDILFDDKRTRDVFGRVLKDIKAKLPLQAIKPGNGSSKASSE
jgi:hypothetical protein